MIHPELEQISVYEGPALPIFDLLPKGHSFWFVRIVWEPVFVFFAAILLSEFLIIQTSLKIYLEAAALFLAMKNYIAWYRSWAYLRNLMDMANMGPILAGIVNSTATDEQLERVHLASLPRDLPEEMRRATAERMARTFPTQDASKEKPAGTANPEAGFAGLRFILQALIAAAVICAAMAWFTGYRQHIRMAAQHLTIKRSAFGGHPDSASPQVPAVNIAPAPAPPPPALTRLMGYWQGRAYLANRGMCILKIELRPAPQNQFSAYTSLECIPLGGRYQYPNVGLNPPSAVATILSGAATDRSILFYADRSIDGAKNGCGMGTLSVAPFGAKQVAVDWQDGPCHGGQMVLQRVPQ